MFDVYLCHIYNANQRYFLCGLHPSGNPERYVTVTLKALPWTPKGGLLHLVRADDLGCGQT